MKIRKPVNFYDVHGVVCVLTIVRQEGRLEYALFDSDIMDSMAANGPFHIRCGVIYSVRGFTLQNLLAKIYGLGAIHTHIGCDFRRGCFEKKQIANKPTATELHLAKARIANSTETHPKTGVYSEIPVVELTSFLSNYKPITFKINAKYAHLVPIYVKFNAHWGICTRKGLQLTRILRRAGLVNTQGKCRLRNLLDYTISDGLFVCSSVHRFVWADVVTDSGIEGHTVTVCHSELSLMKVFLDDAGYDVCCDKHYNPRLVGMAQDIMEAAGYEVRNVHVPARLKKYYARALDKGVAGYASRAKYENDTGMSLMTKAKRVRYKKIISEKVVYIKGVEYIDMRADSMRLCDDRV